jgi:hypothetical protein
MTVKFVCAWSRRVAACFGVAAAALFCFGAEAPAGSAAATNILRMHFRTNGVGETILEHAQVSSPLQKATNRVVNASELARNKGAQFSLVPTDSTVQMSSEQFPGWEAELLPKQSLLFGFDYPDRTMNLASSDLNQMPVRLAFPDGASVEMDAASDGRLEFMDDGTYAFFGAGAMRGKNADGGPVRFGNVFPPLFGGQLVAPSTNDLNGRFKRATPVTQLTFLGQIETGVTARVGKEEFKLAPGVEQKIALTNGARIALKFNAETRSVEWKVARGVFRLNVDGFSCFKTLGASGQGASMQWDTNGVMMQLKNLGSAGAFQPTLLVNLNPSLNVAVGTSATFQYGRTGDCSTFVATASGGETTLYNAASGKYVRLDEGNMSIVSGAPDRGSLDAQAAPKTAVRLAWSSDEEVALTGPGGTYRVAVNGEESFDLGNGHDVKVRYAGKDQLDVRAEVGGVSITPDFMPNISIEIGEGSGVTMGYDRGADIFRVAPQVGNLTAVGVRTATGFYPQINPGQRLTFVINRSSVPSAGEGDLIFTETAGAGPVATTPGGAIPPGRAVSTGRGGGTLLGGANDNLDTSRINQPPVTTLE